MADSNNTATYFTTAEKDTTTQRLAELVRTGFTGDSSSSSEMGSSLTTLVTLVQQIVHQLTGFGHDPFGLGTAIRGSLSSMGALPVTSMNGSVSLAAGTGNITDSITRQIADAIQKSSSVNTAVGTVDRFAGVNEDLKQQLIGDYIYTHTPGKGDILQGSTGTTLESVTELMDSMARNGASDEVVDELGRITAVMTKMDELANQLESGATYQDLTEEQQIQVQDRLRGGVDFYDNEIKSYYDVDGIQTDVGKGDIENALKIANGRSMDVHAVSKNYTDNLTSELTDQFQVDIGGEMGAVSRSVSDIIGQFSKMMGGMDLEGMTAMAKKLRMDSITSKQGATDLLHLMSEVQTNAEMTGKSVGEVLEGYSQIADSLSASGQTFSAGDVSALYESGESFARDERSGRYKGNRTASERMEIARQEQINEDNQLMGRYAADMLLEGNAIDDETRSKLTDFKNAMDEAVAAGDHTGAMEIANQMKNYITAQRLVDFSDVTELRRVMKQKNVHYDAYKAMSRDTAFAENAANVAKAAIKKDDVLGASYSTDEFEDTLLTFWTAIGETSPDAINSLNTAVLSYMEQGLEGNDLIDAINADKNLTESEKGFLLEATKNKSLGDVSTFLTRGLMKNRTNRWMRAGDLLATSMPSDIDTQAKDALYAQIADKVGNKNLDSDDVGPMEAFLKGVFGTDGLEPKQIKEKAEALKKQLSSDDVAEQVDALLQIKDKDGKALFSLTDEEKEEAALKGDNEETALRKKAATWLKKNKGAAMDILDELIETSNGEIKETKKEAGEDGAPKKEDAAAQTKSLQHISDGIDELNNQVRRIASA